MELGCPDGAELPAVLDATCVVCPHGTTPDDCIDFEGLWGSLCGVAATRRLSSTITARALSKSLGLRRFLVLPAGGRSDAQLSTGESTGNHKRSAGQRAEAEAESAALISAVRHPALSLARQPDRGREFVCTAKEGLAAGVCVLVEEPVVSVLDTEVQREKEWWDVDGADTCSLFCAWMLQLLDEMHAHRRAHGDLEAPPATRRAEATVLPAAVLGSRLYQITEHLHPAAPTGGSTEKQWLELYDSLPADVQGLMDTVVSACSPRPQRERTGKYSACQVDLPIIWQRLQLNQMGSYTHPEHVAGAYERTWRFLTGTGIYALTSVGFNHSCRPNVLRVSAGPLIFFRTSRPVACGEPLTISYVGTDLLCEPLDIRLGEDEEQGGGLGDRDFTCCCPLCAHERMSGAMGQTSSTVLRYDSASKSLLPYE